MGENFHKFSALCCCSAVIVAGTFILLWISIASISVSHAHSSLFSFVDFNDLCVHIFSRLFSFSAAAHMVSISVLLLLVFFFSVCRHSGSRYHVLLHFPSYKALNSALLSRASWSERLKRNCVIIKAFSGFLTHDTTVEKGHKKLSSESQKSSSKCPPSRHRIKFFWYVELSVCVWERTFSWNSESVQFPVRVGFVHFNSCPWHKSKEAQMTCANKSLVNSPSRQTSCVSEKETIKVTSIQASRFGVQVYIRSC